MHATQTPSPTPRGSAASTARSRAIAAMDKPPSAVPKPTPRRTPAAPPTREVLGFAPYWTLDTWPQWRMQDLTDIAYFGVTIDGNGNTVADEMWPSWQSQTLTDMVNNAHAHHVRVFVTVKCFDGGDINSIVTDGGHLATAVQTATDLMRMRGLDGVVLDFEGAQDPAYPFMQQGLNQFVSALHASVKAYRGDAQLVVAGYASGAAPGGLYDVHAIAPYVDSFFVMGYDMASADLPGQAAANAPLQIGQYNDTSAVQQYTAAAGANKVILGVPYYGYKWSVVSTDANAATTDDGETVTYDEMLADEACAPNLGMHDQNTAMPWITWYSPPEGDPCGGNLNTWREAYIDNATSLGAKYNLVLSAGLRGTGMWALGFDAGHNELWDALQSHLTAKHY